MEKKNCLRYQGHRVLDPDTSSSKNEDQRPIRIQKLRILTTSDIYTLAEDTAIWQLAGREFRDIYNPASSEYTEAGKKYNYKFNIHMSWSVCMNEKEKEEREIKISPV